ncbi:MAG: efflux RND transporter periplasmic adaptor subunit [Patescibacteria group bacterium]|nr:efflux RND transporter periplasmic adaptor subunit [Patescibacteria group bacterium]
MRKIIIILTLLVVSGFVIYRFFLSQKTTYETARVEKKDLNIYINTSGKIKAEEGQTVSFPIEGTVSKIASTGAQIKKGEVLAELSAGDLWAGLQQAYAALNKARSTFYYYLEVKSQADATYGWKSDQASIAQVNQAANNVAAAQDSVQAAQFALDGARAAYNKAVILASFNGVVGSTAVKSGETVAPGQVVLNFLNPDSFYFEAEVDESDVKSVKIDQTAEVNLDSFPGVTIEGKVYSLDLTSHLTSSGGTAYFAKISLENLPQDLVLRSGLNGEAQILGEVKKNALTIQAAYVTLDGGQYEVLVSGGGSAPQKRKVEVGELVGNEYEITQGLTEGETVLKVKTGR